jgi:geranylgeranyl diphosphate/geranylgeranyl-bacteriochlorophyllide a reductase
MKPPKYRTGVLVIGGGPAGATAAGVLAEKGREVLLLEKNRAYNKPCGGGVALGLFDEFNLPRTSIRREVYGLRLVSPAGNQVNIPLSGHPVALVERKEFDEALRLKAEQKGAQVIEGEFLSILDEKKGLVLALIQGKKTEIQSEFIIAADGVNSRVRTSLGIKPLPALWTSSAVIQGQREFCEFWFGASESPYSYSWIFPTAAGLSVGTGALEARTLQKLFHNFLNRSGLEVQVKRRVYRIPVWQGKLFNQKKFLFVGDAAGQVLPLSYEGIYYAMKGGEMAARAILEGKPGNYKKMWKGEFRKRFLLLDTLKNYFLKNDASAEKLIALHRHPEVQEISLRLWLRQEDRRHTLFHYLKLLGKYLR